MFTIFEQRQPPTRKPFRLVETRPSVDGPRSRLTDKTFTTFGEAEAFVRSFEAKAVGS